MYRAAAAAWIPDVRLTLNGLDVATPDFALAAPVMADCYGLVDSLIARL